MSVEESLGSQIPICDQRTERHRSCPPKEHLRVFPGYTVGRVGSVLRVTDIEPPTLALAVGMSETTTPLGMSVGEARFVLMVAIGEVTLRLNEGPAKSVLGVGTESPLALNERPVGSALNVGMAIPELKSVGAPAAELAVGMGEVALRVNEGPVTSVLRVGTEPALVLNGRPVGSALNVGIAMPELRSVGTPGAELAVGMVEFELIVAVAVELPASGASGVVGAPPWPLADAKAVNAL